MSERHRARETSWAATVLCHLPGNMHKKTRSEGLRPVPKEAISPEERAGSVHPRAVGLGFLAGPRTGPGPAQVGDGMARSLGSSALASLSFLDHGKKTQEVAMDTLQTEVCLSSNSGQLFH